MDKEKAKQAIQEIIKEFRENSGRYRKEAEANTETKLVEPLFKALGWNEKDWVKQERVHRGQALGRADYAFRIGEKIVFFLEVKKVGIPLDKEADKQVISYALSKRIPFAVSTNFEELKIFCVEQENALKNKFRVFNSPEAYLANFDDLLFLSKESFEQDLILKKAGEEGRLKKRVSIDKTLLEDLMHIRGLIANDIEKRYIGKYLINEKDDIVQRIIDRLIFIRRAEDLGINPEDKKIEEIRMLPDNKAYPKLKELFKLYNDVYNSGLFVIAKDNDCDSINIDGGIIKKLAYYLYESRDKEYIYNFEWIDADVLGQVYEQYLGKLLAQTKSGKAKLKEGQAHRKEQGIYYTPTYIVDYIVKNTLGEMLKDKKKDIKNIKVLDPACGSGSFLIKAFDYLSDAYKDEQHKLDIQGNYSVKTDILKRNLYGVDLDNKAVEIAKLNLLLKAAEKNRKLPEEVDLHLRKGNSLIDDENVAGLDAFKWVGDFQEGSFDVVIGNPPYVFAREKINDLEKDYYIKNYETLKYQINTYVLFIERSVKLLKQNGLLGFIVPDAWLRVESVSNLRKFLLQNTFLEKIVHIRGQTFEGVGVEASILILKKTKDIGETCICKDIMKSDYTKTLQKNWLNNSLFEIDLFSNNKIKIILDKLEDKSSILDDVAIIKAGLQAYESGKGNPKQSAIDVKNRPYDYNHKHDKDTFQYLEGKDISRYSYGWNNVWLRYGEWLAAPRSFDLFSLPRLLVREIPSKPPYSVVAVYLENTFLNNRSIINILKKDNSIELKYILGILNSRLMSFYHINKSVKAQRDLFPKITLNDLRKFPIKVMSLEKQQPIIKLVDKMLSLNKRLNEIGDKKTSETARIEEEIKKTDNEIDELVYKLYGITEDEKKIIEESLK